MVKRRTNMAYVIDVPANEAERIIVMDKNGFENVIETRLGTEFYDNWREAVADWEYEHEGIGGDDYEAIADDYLQMLIDIRDELDAILSKKRIDKKALEMLNNRIYNMT
jgi:hypothetical protein